MKREHGDGGIDARGENSWRLRYRVAGRRYAKTFHGTRAGAQKELRRLLSSADQGQHVAPDRITLQQWAEQWLSIGAPGRRQRKGSRRSLDRYTQLMRCHILPKLGHRRLQQLQAGEIDTLYAGLKCSPRTALNIH